MKFFIPKYSLKALLLIVLVAAAILGWRELVVKRHYKAIAKLEERGALLWDEWDDRLGVTGYYNCNLEGSHFGTEDVDLLTNLWRLEAVTIRDCRLSPSDLGRLAELPDLKYLTIDIDCISDSHINELNRIRQLKTLGISQNHATASAIQSLRESLPNCEVTVY